MKRLLHQIKSLDHSLKKRRDKKILIILGSYHKQTIQTSKDKEAKMVSIAKQIVIEKSAVITFENEVAEMAFRRYLKDNWEKLTLGLNDSTILFLAGVHGSDSGQLGPNENIQTLKNQVRILNNYKPIHLDVPYDFFL